MCVSASINPLDNHVRNAECVIKSSHDRAHADQKFTCRTRFNFSQTSSLPDFHIFHAAKMCTPKKLATKNIKYFSLTHTWDTFFRLFHSHSRAKRNLSQSFSWRYFFFCFIQRAPIHMEQFIALPLFPVSMSLPLSEASNWEERG